MIFLIQYINKMATHILLGHALADALGAPIEFRHNKQKYSGDFSVPPISHSRWQGIKKALCGQWTDDTEMALCLWTSLVKNEMSYNRNDVIMAYMQWANSKPFGMGVNTRKLFHGIKTLRGYNNRIKKLDCENAQSNGCLMRAWPLAFTECDPSEDTSITNPNYICIFALQIYVAILKQIIAGEAVLIELSDDTPDQIKCAVSDGRNENIRDITINKGWVAHGLYCAILATYKFNSYLEGVDAIILLGGDTDTNGAIAGAILAARFPTFAEDEPRANQLLNEMLACDTSIGSAPRPDLYHPKSYV